MNITHRPAQWKRLREPISIPFWLAAILVAWHMVETIHTFQFIAENLKWLTTAWGNVSLILFGFVWFGLILFGKNKPRAEWEDQNIITTINPHAEPNEDQIQIATQGLPVTIRFSEAQIGFSIFSCFPIVLTFVELRLENIVLKEPFQQSMAPLEPHFVSMTKTLSADELKTLKSWSLPIRVIGTAKFGALQKNFEFSTIPYLIGQAVP